MRCAGRRAGEACLAPTVVSGSSLEELFRGFNRFSDALGSCAAVAGASGNAGGDGHDLERSSIEFFMSGAEFFCCQIPELTLTRDAQSHEFPDDFVRLAERHALTGEVIG